MKCTRLVLLCSVFLCAAGARALERPWIGAVYFYWYEWNGDQRLGNWINGVYNTPLAGYYDSRRFDDNLRSIHQAAEWGISHLFMDYWGRGWKDDHGNPREDAVMRATEQLRKRGYDIAMSFYQDGQDFDMLDFAANLESGRDAEFYLRRYGRSSAMVRHHGKPLALIYARNGRPKLTDDDIAFRRFLQQKYGGLDALRHAWQRPAKAWDELRLDFSRGQARADSIAFAQQTWSDNWQQAERRAREQWELPGFTASFDVGYRPYLGHGYSGLAKSLCGPHSYAGIFGRPDEQDVERFIQAQVARRYDTVFFDTFKNYYFDWEIRIPGQSYPPAFAAFDRFWVQALMHYSEAVLHLSWNEWWEGSNLEPCREYGKRYCEKNHFWSTLARECFDSIHHWDRNARAAVLLNDHHWLVGGRGETDIYGCIQALRRRNIPFVLLPDDFVTAQELARFSAVIAPTGGAGFGVNAQGENIGSLLRRWVEEKDDRRLVVSRWPEAKPWLGLKSAAPSAAERSPGKRMTVFVDIGEEGDDRFLVQGCSHREDWGSLPAGEFGATRGRHTVRWTPAVGAATLFRLPASPHRDHVLRLEGSAIAENEVVVRIADREAARFHIAAGRQQYEVRIPAAAIGHREVVELELVYQRANIPRLVNPQRWPNESRVCNLAIDWVQFATADTPLTTKQEYRMPQPQVRFTARAPSPVGGRTWALSWAPRDTVADSGAVVWSRYADGIPRDMVLHTGLGQTLYCNGLLGALEQDEFWAAVVEGWAGLRAERSVRGRGVMGVVLRAGATDIVLAYNYQAPSRTEVAIRAPRGQAPVAEVRLLSRDGGPGSAVGYQTRGGDIIVQAPIRYEAVIAIVRSPVALETGEPALEPGAHRIPLRLTNLTNHSQTCEITATAHLPSVRCSPVRITVPPKGSVRVAMPVSLTHDVDWGRKALVFHLQTQSGEATFWRQLVVLRPPQLEVRPGWIDAAHPVVVVRNQPNEYIANATAKQVAVMMSGQRFACGDLPSGAERRIRLPVPPAGERPSSQTLAARIEYADAASRHADAIVIHFADTGQPRPLKPGALARVICFLRSETVAGTRPARIGLAKLPSAARRGCHLVDGRGHAIPSQVVGDELWFLCPRTGEDYLELDLVPGTIEAPAALTVTSRELGSGQGEVTVTGQRFRAALSEAAGGVMTSLVSLATQRDYAAGAFGASYGTWGRYDPRSPRMDAVTLVGQERKRRQRAGGGSLEVEAAGPLMVEVVAHWRDDEVESWQRYHFFAGTHFFRVKSYVRALRRPPRELVVMDVWLRRNQLTKIYPNFTGIAPAFQKPNPHAGWREGPYVPPVTTLMTPPQFAESVSLLVRGSSGLGRYRQGFWPAERPRVGPVDFAEVEYIAAPGAGAAWVETDVVLHAGHQAVAHDFQRQQPPLIEVMTP